MLGAELREGLVGHRTHSEDCRKVCLVNQERHTSEYRAPKRQRDDDITARAVEPASPTGEFFSFDPMREISGKSAQEIADAAVAWGQKDDITVVTRAEVGRLKLLLFAVMAATSALAQNALWIDLSGNWKLGDGDHSEFAAVELDDRSWPDLALPRGGQSSHETKYWLRRRVDLPEGADRRQLALTLGALQDVYESIHQWAAHRRHRFLRNL